MIKITKQHDIQDCGAACLSMICAHYGLNLPLGRFRELVGVDNDGANVLGIVKGSQKLGLIADALKGTRDELLNDVFRQEIKVPFIAHVIVNHSFEHYVVVYKLTKNFIYIADPAKGRQKYSHHDFFDIWSGHIITFALGSTFKKENSSTGILKHFTTVLQTQKQLLLPIILISVGITAISVLGSFLLQIIVDGLNAHLPFTQLNNTLSAVCIGIIFLFLIQAGFFILRSFLLCKLSMNIDASLMLNFYSHIMKLPIKDIGTRKTGDIISRFSDASNIRNALSEATLSLILDTIMIIVTSIILYFINNLLFYFALVFITIFAIVSVLFIKPNRKSNERIMINNAEVISYLKESIDGIETIKAFSSESNAINKTAGKLNKLLRSSFHDSMISSTQISLTNLIASIGLVILLWQGASLVTDQTISVGALLTFYSLFMYFLDSVKNMVNLLPEIQSAAVATDRLNDLLNLATEAESKKEIDCNNDIKIQKLDFRYGYRELVLKDIDIDIKKGTTVALVGESGSGKTTLAKLLMGFYSSERGSITIGDTDITKADPKYLRNQIAYVPQNTFLFSDTIMNNLLLGNPDATFEEVEQACKLSKAAEFIKQLPLGYDTLIGENGTGLSGGQKQRLAIARALLKKPKILILDEATSNLDTVTECSIKETIHGLKGQITCIIIAHRLSTIKNCDIIYVMENGKVIEKGTHEKLLENMNLYYRFYNQ